MRVRLCSYGLALDACTARLPFRFGVSTLTSAPSATLRVEVENERGERGEGFSADLLVPKWFDKRSTTTVTEDQRALVASVEGAARAFADRGAGCTPLFDLWLGVHHDRVESCPSHAPDRLVRGFGVALVERAMIDAACRLAGLSFFDALASDLFAIDASRVHSSLAGWELRPLRGADPKHSWKVLARHTVGLADDLRESDVDASTRPRDGLPCSLEGTLRAYGHRHVKIKVSGRPDADLERLRVVAGVLLESAPADWRATLDGNEQFTDPGALAGLLNALAEDSAGRELVGRLTMIEQPCPRAATFEPSAKEGIARLSAFAPVIIDEADDGVGAFTESAAIGYRGVSVKACKGVFRAILNRGLVETSGGRFFQSGEDLTNLGVLALQQDLALMLALGIGHVERNGHHYFRGLAHLPASEQDSALQTSARLYAPIGGTPCLKITGGEIDGSDLAVPGFGYAAKIAWGERSPAERWFQSTHA